MYLIRCRLPNGYYRILLAKTQKQILELWKARCEDAPHVLINAYCEVEVTETASTKLYGKSLAIEARHRYDLCISELNRFIEDNWDKIPHLPCPSLPSVPDLNGDFYCRFWPCRLCGSTRVVPLEGWPSFLKRAWLAYEKTKLLDKNPRTKYFQHSRVSPTLDLNEYSLNKKSKFKLARIPNRKLWCITLGTQGQPEFNRLSAHNIRSAHMIFRFVKDLPEEGLVEIRTAAEETASARKIIVEQKEEEVRQKREDLRAEQVARFFKLLRGE